MQVDWLVDENQIAIGLIRHPVDEILEQLSGLTSVLKSQLETAIGSSTVTRYRQQKGESQAVLFHRPFFEMGLNYDIFNQAILRAPGHAKTTQWLSLYSMFPNLRRKFWMVWSFESELRITLTAGVNGSYFYPELTDLDTESRENKNSISVALFAKREVHSEARSTLEIIASAAVLAFEKSYLLNADSIDSTLNGRGSLGFSGSVLGVPAKGTVDGLNQSQLLTLLPKIADDMISSLGQPRNSAFTVYIESHDRLLPHCFKCLASSPPRVWTLFVTDSYPCDSFDIFATPQDKSIVRAYPLLTVQTPDTTCIGNPYQLEMQLNLVHAYGESFIEIQVYQDKKWLDRVANFFQAPIDIWEGPIEDRFGWYGDASRGRVVRLDPDPTEILTTEKIVKSYLVAPMRPWYCRDGETRDAVKLYTTPQAIFDTRQSAEDWAIQHAQQLMYFRLCEHTTMLYESGFELENFPSEVQRRAREILGIGPADNWKEELEGLRGLSLTDEQNAELIQLLGVKTYRILELTCEESEWKKLRTKIDKKKIDKKTERWLADRLGQILEKNITEDFDGID